MFCFRMVIFLAEVGVILVMMVSSEFLLFLFGLIRNMFLLVVSLNWLIFSKVCLGF